MYIPLNYDHINAIEGSYQPSVVKYRNNQAFDFWIRSLFQRACSVVEAELPEEWTGSVKDFLYYCLFRFGYVPVWYSAEYGYTFQPGNLSGYNWYYQPTTALIANPLLKQPLELEIGKDCEILKLTPDYRGIWDVICYYAEKLSLLDSAINMSLINNKYAFFLGARNKVAGQALKKMLDLIHKGEPAVVYDMKLLNDPTDKVEPFQVWERSNLKNNYLTTDQLKDFQTLINNFDAEVGIPTIPYEKKERMVASEADSRQIDSQSRATIWIETLNSSADAIKKIYPDINLSFKLRYEAKEVDADEPRDNDADRTV